MKSASFLISESSRLFTTAKHALPEPLIMAGTLNSPHISSRVILKGGELFEGFYLHIVYKRKPRYARVFKPL